MAVVLNYNESKDCICKAMMLRFLAFFAAVLCNIPGFAHNSENNSSPLRTRELYTRGSRNSNGAVQQKGRQLSDSLQNATKQSRFLLEEPTVPYVSDKTCSSVVGASALERHTAAMHGDVCRCVTHVIRIRGSVPFAGTSIYNYEHVAILIACTFAFDVLADRFAEKSLGFFCPEKCFQVVSSPYCVIKVMGSPAVPCRVAANSPDGITPSTAATITQPSLEKKAAMTPIAPPAAPVVMTAGAPMCQASDDPARKNGGDLVCFCKTLGFA